MALQGGPLVLSDVEALPSVVGGYISAIRDGVTASYVYGGPAALSQAVVDDITVALSG